MSASSRRRFSARSKPEAETSKVSESAKDKEAEESYEKDDEHPVKKKSSAWFWGIVIFVAILVIGGTIWFMMRRGAAVGEPEVIAGAPDKSQSSSGSAPKGVATECQFETTWYPKGSRRTKKDISGLVIDPPK